MELIGRVIKSPNRNVIFIAGGAIVIIGTLALLTAGPQALGHLITMGFVTLAGSIILSIA